MPITDQERLRLLLPPDRRVRAVLDTDTYNEIDDQFAIVQALLSPDRISLEAIYAAPFHNKRSTGPGNGMDESYDEIHRLLDRMGRSPKGFVFRGVRDYVGTAKQPHEAEAVNDLVARARASTPDASTQRSYASPAALRCTACAASVTRMVCQPGTLSSVV